MSTEHRSHYSRDYKRAHPERAREYNRRSNAKRPDRERFDYNVCECGKRKTRKAKMCIECWQNLRPRIRY
jgi:hypothetical protein